MHVLSNITLKPSENYLTLKLIPFFTDFTLLFMIVSGFSLCCGYYERFKKGTITPNSFYKKRYARILPYFACLCLLDLVMNPSRGAFFETFANLTLCFNLLPNPHITVIGVGWFLGVVFVFYLLFPFFVFMTDNKRRAWLSMLIALGFVWVAMLYFYTPEFVDKSPGRTNFIYCAPLFLSGGIAYLYRKSICQWGGKYSSLCAVFTVLLTNAFLNNRVARYISNISMEIYLAHMVIFRVIEKVHIERFISQPDMNYIVTCIIVLGGVICFAHIMKYYVLQRVVNWIEK